MAEHGVHTQQACSSVPRWAEHEVERVSSCPVCHAPADAEGGLLGLRDYLEDVPGEWAACSCPDCGCIYLTVRPTLGAIGKAYASYYTHGNARAAHEADNGSTLRWRLVNGYLNRRFAAARQPARAVGAWLVPWLLPLRLQLDFFFRHLPWRTGALLDIGAGNGVFLLRAQQAGWRVVGLDTDPLACAAAAAAGVEVRQAGIEELPVDEQFDVITVSHVLEHVHAPADFLSHIHRHLKPGAMLWIATPNARSIGRHWFGSVWRGLEPPRHIVVFSREALERSLRAAGYVDIRFRRRGRGAGYILKSSAAIARLAGVDVRTLPAVLVDLLACLSPVWGEELVVTARKPS